MKRYRLNSVTDVAEFINLREQEGYKALSGSFAALVLRKEDRLAIVGLPWKGEFEITEDATLKDYTPILIR